MNYNVQTTKVFEKQFKKSISKYPYLKEVLINFIHDLESDNIKSISLGKKIFKCRLSLPKSKGSKSSGFRIIYFLNSNTKEIILLTIYDKKQISNLKLNEIIDILKRSGYDDL